MRKRSDTEILAKFAPLVVPTYHGDTDLFGSALFAEFAKGLGLKKSSLKELMER